MYDGSWEDALGEYPKLPSEKRAREYYEQWAASDTQWRKMWEKDEGPTDAELEDYKNGIKNMKI